MQEYMGTITPLTIVKTVARRTAYASMLGTPDRTTKEPITKEPNATTGASKAKRLCSFNPIRIRTNGENAKGRSKYYSVRSRLSKFFICSLRL